MQERNPDFDIVNMNDDNAADNKYQIVPNKKIGQKLQLKGDL